MNKIILLVFLLGWTARASTSPDKKEEASPPGFCATVLTIVKAKGLSSSFDRSTYADAFRTSAGLAAVVRIVNPKAKAGPSRRLMKTFAALTGESFPSGDLYRDILRVFLDAVVTTSERGQTMTQGQLEIRNWLTVFARLPAMARPDIQGLIVDAIQKMMTHSNSKPRIIVERLLFEIAAHPEVGFTQDTIHLFDTLPLDDKDHLVNFQVFGLEDRAVHLLRQWRAAINLEKIKQEVDPALEEFFSTGSDRSLFGLVNIDLSFSAGHGYYDTDAVRAAIAEEASIGRLHRNGLYQALHQLLQYRIGYGLSHPDVTGVGRQTRLPRFVEPSTYFALIIFSWLNQRGGTSLSPREMFEIKSLLQEKVTPEIRETLRSGITIGNDREEPLSWPIRFVAWQELDQFLAGDFSVNVLGSWSTTLSYALRNQANWKMGE